MIYRNKNYIFAFLICLLLNCCVANVELTYCNSELVLAEIPELEKWKLDSIVKASSSSHGAKIAQNTFGIDPENVRICKFKSPTEKMDIWIKIDDSDQIKVLKK